MADLVYDVGMFDGSDSAHYLSLGYRVVAVEANPHYVELARRRFADEIASGQFIIEACGVGETEGDAPFWVVRKMPHKSTFDEAFARQVGGDDIEMLTIRTRPLRRIMEQHGRGHYVKVDIEEFDELCIADLHGELMPDYVSAEMGTKPHILDLLRDIGFTGFKCISQFSQLPLPLTDLPDAQRLIRYQRFLESTSLPARVARRLGARDLVMRRLHPQRENVSVFTSGDFGEMTPGPWKSFDEASTFYRAFVERNPNGATWVDAHARAPHVA